MKKQELMDNLITSALIIAIVGWVLWCFVLLFSMIQRESDWNAEFERVCLNIKGADFDFEKWRCIVNDGGIYREYSVSHTKMLKDVYLCK
jgi:hypothetical protein